MTKTAANVVHVLFPLILVRQSTLFQNNTKRDTNHRLNVKKNQRRAGNDFRSIQQKNGINDYSDPPRAFLLFLLQCQDAGPQELSLCLKFLKKSCSFSAENVRHFKCSLRWNVSVPVHTIQPDSFLWPPLAAS